MVAAAYGAELDARDASPLKVDDVGSTVEPDTHGVVVEVPCCDLAKRFYEGALCREASRFVQEKDLHLRREIYRADLAYYLLRVLLGQVTDVKVICAAVRDAVYNVTAGDAGQVDARVREELTLLSGERQL